MLNDDLIRAAKPGTVLTEPESPGLRMAVGKSRRTWCYRWRKETSLRQVVLGHYPAVSISGARAKWDALREQRAHGLDIEQQRDANKAQAKAAIAIKRAGLVTVDRICRDYLVTVAGSRNEKSAGEVRRLFERELDPIRHIPATELAVAPAAAMLEAIIDRGAPSIARALRQELGGAWKKAVTTGLLPLNIQNPFDFVLAGDKRLQPRKGTRVFSDAEIAAWLRWLPLAGMSDSVQAVLELTLRLGCRSGEIISAEWAQFSGNAWTLRSQDTKTGAGRTIILPRQAAQIVAGRPQGQFLFPSPIEGTAMRQTALAWATAHAAECPVKDWSPHDLRRTMRTGLSRLGVQFDVAEAAIGHSVKGVAGVYDLHQRTQEVGAALQTWNDHIDQVLK